MNCRRERSPISACVRTATKWTVLQLSNDPCSRHDGTIDDCRGVAVCDLYGNAQWMFAEFALISRNTVSERRKMRAGHRLQLVERNEGKARIAQPTGAQF